MDEQVSKEEILNKTLYTLVRHLGLTPAEVSALRLTDLHLAGKSPNITVGAQGDQPKTIELDLETHRALVGWLVTRPDSVSDFLFLDQDSEPLSPLSITQTIEEAAQADLDSDTPLKTGTFPSPEPDIPTEEESSSDQTTVSPPRPEPLPARPAPTAPPPTTPEIGVPPRDIGSATTGPSSPQPPTRVPEQGGPSSPPSSGSPRSFPFRPFPPSLDDDEATGQTPAPSKSREADHFPRPVAPEPRPTPRSVKEKKQRVPPKPIRRKGAVPAPVIVPGKEPDQPSPPASQEPASPPADLDNKLEETKRESIPLEADAKPGPSSAREPARLSPPPIPGEDMNRPALFSFGLGGGLIILAFCVICAGGIGWFAVQSEAGAGFLASLGLGPAAEIAEPTDPSLVADRQDTSTFDSPLPTPTFPPTSTPSPIPPTNTPLPTDTATSVPEATELLPTSTPLPTGTPAPTDSPVSQTPAATSGLAETPTPAVSPTPTLKYEAPVLIEPEEGFRFISGNTIVLRWQPVDLAPDEQYAVRLVYKFHDQVTFQGANIKEPEWLVPRSLFGQIDPPENLYEWFVVIERLNEDGSGTAISPESERRTFTWK